MDEFNTPIDLSMPSYRHRSSGSLETGHSAVSSMMENPDFSDAELANATTTTSSMEDNPDSVSGQDLLSIKNIIEEKKRLQREEQQFQESLEDAESASQISSVAQTTPASPAMAILATRRGLRGRRKRSTLFNESFGRKFNFVRSLIKLYGKHSLRRTLSRNTGLRNRDNNLSDGKRPEIGSGTSKISTNDYYRPLFVTHFDDSSPSSPADEPIDTSHFTVDDNDSANDGLSSGNGTRSEDHEMEKALSQYFEVGLLALNELQNDAQKLATTVVQIQDQTKNLRGRSREMDSNWKNRLIRLADTIAKKRSLEGVLKLVEDVYYVELTSRGNPDEWTIRRQSIKRSGTLLRQCFAHAIASHGLPIMTWIHWFLMDHLPTELAALYLLMLRELHAEIPDLLLTVLNSDEMINRRVIELITGFLIDHNRLNLSTDLFFLQRLPPRLPRDPVIMLVSSTMKAHNDMVVRGSLRCQYFYKNLFPHLGSCTDVRFTPFKKGMYVGACADQLHAFLKDKIREVQYFNANRPVVLVGWQTSGFVALKVALEKSLAAVVCLGFPNLTLNGVRGAPGDDMLDVTCPTLFVVGQFAPTCSIADLHEARKRMKSENTGLIVVGGANDELKMSDAKLNSENLCQDMVDRCILECIGEFLAPTLEAYVEPSDNAPVACASSGLTIKVEGETAAPSMATRRRHTFGQASEQPILTSPSESTIKMRMRSGSKLNPAMGQTAVEEKPTNSGGPLSKETPSTSTQRGSIVTISGNDNSTPSVTATRKRQIKKPHLLDL